MYNLENYRKLDLRELQMMLLQAMKDIHKVCVENDINYYMNGGTFLGSIRHKGFIPWDDDMDIIMMRDDFEKFKNIFPKVFDKNKYFLQHYDSDIDFRPASMHFCINNTIYDYPPERHLKNHKGIHIDIFPLDNVPDKEYLRLRQARQIRVLGDLIYSKLYKDYSSKYKIVTLLRVIKHSILTVVPLKFLQKRKVKVMKKYNGQITQCVASMQSHYSYKKQTMRREVYGKPQLYEFECEHFYGPEMYNEYLTKLFGNDYMELPPVEKRVVPLNSYIKNEG